MMVRFGESTVLRFAMVSSSLWLTPSVLHQLFCLASRRPEVIPGRSIRRRFRVEGNCYWKEFHQRQNFPGETVSCFILICVLVKPTAKWHISFPCFILCFVSHQLQRGDGAWGCYSHGVAYPQRRFVTAIVSPFFVIIFMGHWLCIGFEGEMTCDNIEVGVVDSSGKFRVLTPSEVKDYLEEAE
jgi:hypothetical protein